MHWRVKGHCCFFCWFIQRVISLEHRAGLSTGSLYILITGTGLVEPEMYNLPLIKSTTVNYVLLQYNITLL